MSEDCEPSFGLLVGIGRNICRRGRSVTEKLNILKDFKWYTLEEEGIAEV